MAGVNYIIHVPSGVTEIAGGRFTELPSWFQLADPETWVNPVSNSLPDIEDALAQTTNRGSTGPQSIIQAWTGFAFDDTRKLMVSLAQGGHDDYYGNEVPAVDFRADPPTWVSLRAASAADGDGTSDYITWTDGRPVASHGYCQNVGAEGRIIMCSQGSRNYGGNTSDNWFEFDLTAGDWINKGNVTSGLTVNAQGKSACWNPATRQILFVNSNNKRPAVQFVDIDTLTVVSTTSPGVATDLNMAIASTEVDTTNNHLVAFGNITTVFAMDLADIASGWKTIVTTRAHGANKMVWHPPSGAFLGWAGGANIHKFTPNAAYTSGVWSTVAMGGVTPPAEPANGIIGKVGLLSFGDEYALIIVPIYAANDVFVCRLNGAI